jgi:hypothetical protein
MPSSGFATNVRPLVGAACPSIVTVGIDPSLANNSAGDILGESIGQTFFASDTLIRSLTVWRVAQEETLYIGIDPYIVGTDSAGIPLPNPVIQHGPVVHVFFGDGVHPIKFKWDFDPPVVLPHRGLYAFFLQVPMDECPSYFDVLGRSPPDQYPEGHLWLSRRTSLCTLRTPDSFPNGDIVFTIEFCHDTNTPVRKSTWGRLRTLYR